MTDKELLEEIIENVEEIMETPYVARKEKAVEVGIKLIMTGKVDFLLRKIDSLEKQNKRYRSLLERVFQAGDLGDVWDVEDDYRDLEGED